MKTSSAIMIRFSFTRLRRAVLLGAVVLAFVVPVSAQISNQAVRPAGIPYSDDMPGSTKPSVAGFMTSMISATPSTNSRPQCAPVSAASSMARR